MSGSFFPSEPNNHAKTQAELRAYELRREAEKKEQRKETFRFWITAVLSGIAALAAVAGVLIQVASMQ